MSTSNSNQTEEQKTGGGTLVALIVAWCWAGIPLAWGIMQTVHKAAALFNQ